MPKMCKGFLSSGPNSDLRMHFDHLTVFPKTAIIRERIKFTMRLCRLSTVNCAEKNEDLTTPKYFLIY